MKCAAPACVALAALVVAIGFGVRAEWVGAGALAALGALWLAGLRYHAGWVSSLGLVGVAAGAGVGALRAAPPLLMLVGVLLALAAWDLDHFAERLRSAGRVEGEAALVRAHMRQLLAALGLTLMLGAVALGTRIQFSFVVAVLLAAVLLVGLRRLVSAAQREKG